MKTSLLLSEKILALIIFAVILPAATLAQWSPKISISPNAMSAGLNENAGPCLAVNGDTVHVVWTDHRSQGFAIYYTHSLDAGLTWSDAIPITDTTGTAIFPAIAVSGLNIHVVWLDSSLGVPASFYKRSLDGGITWGDAVCIDSSTRFWPGVAVSGNMVYVTLNKAVTSTNTEVFLRRSLDNGVTWEAEQQISNADGRSEDPAIAAQGSYVHLSWNDKRSGTMNIYYRRSADAGVTWGPETQLTTYDSYSSMVALDSANVDVAYGSTSSGNFDVWLRQSADTGLAFGAEQQVTHELIGQAYPYMVRKGLNEHLVYLQFDSLLTDWYIHSGDGGVTWDSAFFLGYGVQPYIAVTGCALQVIYPDSGVIYYRRNPTGNCSIASGISEELKNKLTLDVYPNVFYPTTTIEYILPETGKATLKIYNLLGSEVATLIDGERIAGEVNTVVFDASNLNEGMYFCRLSSGNSSVTEKLMLIR